MAMLNNQRVILKFIWWQGALILDCHWWISGSPSMGPEDLDKHSTFWLRFPSGWLASMLPPPSFSTRLMRAQPRLDCGVYMSLWELTEEYPGYKDLQRPKVSFFNNQVLFRGYQFLPIAKCRSWGALRGSPALPWFRGKSIMEPFKSCFGTSYRALVLIFKNCHWLRVTGAWTYWAVSEVFWW